MSQINAKFRGAAVAAWAAVALAGSAAPASESYYSDFLALDAQISAAPSAATRFGDAFTMFMTGGKVQFHSATGVSAGQVLDATSFKGWPRGWTEVDAAYALTDTSVALIRGSDYIVLVFDAATGVFSVFEPPKPLFGEKGPLPESWGRRVDAAVRASAELVMLFRGSEYVTFEVEGGVVSAPQSFTDWPGWPAGWDSIDAAANPGFGVLYFFRGDQYVAFDQSTGKMADFPPQSMSPGAPVAASIEERLNPTSRTVENKSVNLHVANRTAQDIEVLWVDFEGALKPYARLRPFEEYVQQTFDGHVWYARQGDEIVAAYRASTDDTQHFAVFDRAQVADVPEKEAQIDLKLFTDKDRAILPYPNADWLGAGFHLAYVDPANLGAVGRVGDRNTARRTSPFSKMLSDRLSDDGRYILHHGVKLYSSATTADLQREQIVTSVEDIATELSLNFSQGLDVGIAAFSRALSYDHVNKSTTGRESIYMLHRVSARNDRLVMDTMWPMSDGSWRRQRLDPAFEVSVARLGATCADGYDQLLLDYGSHFARSVQFGGQFTQLTRIDKSSYDRFEGDRAAFEQHLRATVPETPVSVSSGQAAGGGRSEGSSGSRESDMVEEFVSGGEAVQDRDSWLRSLGSKPAPVDMVFSPITELLTATFFPDDAEIYAKQEMLRQCVEADYAALGRSYVSLAARGAEPFFEKEIPPELVKKTPDYRYIVDARIVSSQDQCSSLSPTTPEQGAWALEVMSSGGFLTGSAKPFPGRSTIFIDYNLLGGPFSPNLYLCLVTDDRGTPLTRLYPISQNAASGTTSCREGDRRLPQNINEKWNNFGQNDYICVGTNPNEYPLFDVRFTSVVGSIADFTHQASSAGMVLNAGDILYYLHTQDMRQARDAARVPEGNVDVLTNLSLR